MLSANSPAGAGGSRDKGGASVKTAQPRCSTLLQDKLVPKRASSAQQQPSGAHMIMRLTPRAHPPWLNSRSSSNTLRHSTRSPSWSSSTAWVAGGSGAPAAVAAVAVAGMQPANDRLAQAGKQVSDGA